MIIQVSLDDLDRLRTQLRAQAVELRELLARTESTLNEVEGGWSGRIPSGMAQSIDALRARRDTMSDQADLLDQLSAYVGAAVAAHMEVNQALNFDV